MWTIKRKSTNGRIATKSTERMAQAKTQAVEAAVTLSEDNIKRSRKLTGRAINKSVDNDMKILRKFYVSS